jgi:hypothetical protein
MIPEMEYLESFATSDLADRRIDQILRHVAVDASSWGVSSSDIEAIGTTVRRHRREDGRWSVAWTHPDAPYGQVLLPRTPMGAAGLIVRHLLGPRSNYAVMWRTFEAVRRTAPEERLRIHNETDLFGCDWLRCPDTGYALGIINVAGFPLQNCYVLYLWAPRDDMPIDVSAWSAKRIIDEGFKSARTPLREAVLAALADAETPVPAAELRTRLEVAYRRPTTPRELATVIAKEQFAFGSSSRSAYLAPALDELCRPVRGWYTRSDWDLCRRILISGSEDQARKRVQRAYARELLPPWEPSVEAQIQSVAERLLALASRDRYFGIKSVSESADRSR